MDLLTKQIILGLIMLACLYYTFEFIMAAGNQAEIERKVRMEYQKMFDEKIKEIPKITYGCSYQRGSLDDLNFTIP